MVDPKIRGLVGDKIYALAIPQNKDVPAIVYQRISTARTLSLTGESASNPRIQFSAYAKDYATAKDIAMALKASLDFYIGELGGEIKAATYMADYRDDYEPDTGRYRSDVDFFVLRN